ncbi:hypothetical protein P280DRAFT_146173 [Massarina eburnea CBS 473.64]|uniref:SAP domain-containing protein n=1 Tax=Massarina eburnea CBS 473.64 TaxID=1395130 RepID=A0A6A6RMV3_9PLEO|nr:hypothetical protein P280DRAFT_146173 [Massarina eburnea CBS 473.64]
MVLDQASFHRTKPVLDFLRENHTLPAVVPSGCTSLVQPLDTAVNFSLKQLLRQETERLTEEAEDEMLRTLGHCDDWSPWRRRQLTTQAVAYAWENLKTELVVKSFRDCGISLHPDGSEDRELKIKDLPDASFDGWEQERSDYLLKLDKTDKLEVKSEDDENEVLEMDAEGSQGSQGSQKKARRKTTKAPRNTRNYDSWTVKQLRDELAHRGLKKSRLKTELQAQLKEDDARIAGWRLESSTQGSSSLNSSFNSTMDSQGDSVGTSILVE